MLQNHKITGSLWLLNCSNIGAEENYFAIPARLRPGIKMASAYARPSVFFGKTKVFLALSAALMFCT